MESPLFIRYSPGHCILIGIALPSRQTLRHLVLNLGLVGGLVLIGLGLYAAI